MTTKRSFSIEIRRHRILAIFQLASRLFDDSLTFPLNRIVPMVGQLRSRTGRLFTHKSLRCQLKSSQRLEEGILKGTKGFCPVAITEGTPKAVITKLAKRQAEKLDDHRKHTRHFFAHFPLKLEDQKFHLLTRGTKATEKNGEGGNLVIHQLLLNAIYWPRMKVEATDKSIKKFEDEIKKKVAIDICKYLGITDPKTVEAIYGGRKKSSRDIA